MTMEYGLIGGRLGHSWSVPIHAALGLRDYVLRPLTAEEFPGFMEKADFCGINVTIPYKRAVMPYCAVLSEAAKRIGSVNTVVKRKDGSLYGDNTDYAGFLYMADSAGISFSGRQVLILGTGGTAVTARAAAEDRGAASVVNVSRSGPVDYANVRSLYPGTEIVINCTPVGMFPDCGAQPLTLSRFPALCGVIDVIYNPMRTMLLQEAESLGIPHIGGLSMLAEQARLAQARFFGADAVAADIAGVCRRMIREKSSLVLIGMPGGGKTTLGRLAASALNRPFIDTDAEIEREAGISVPEIFASRGEAAFRELETDVLRRVCASGAVVACGGGAVLREENRRLMRAGGCVCHVRRPLSLLAAEGRPLSSVPGALAEMERVRMPLYALTADTAADNNAALSDAVRAVLEGFDAYTRRQRP